MEIREEEEGGDALGDVQSARALVVFDEGGEVEVGGRLEEGRNLLQIRSYTITLYIYPDSKQYACRRKHHNGNIIIRS